jgi:hypothetical protein
MALMLGAAATAAIMGAIHLTRGSSKAAAEDPIETLIGKLASPNAALNPSKDWGPVSRPSSYDLAAQEKVEAAREELKKQDYRRLIPLLIKHRDDNRYCRSDSVTILWDYSVGETCMQILGSVVEPDIRRSGYKGMPQYPATVISPNPTGWWAQHSQMTLEDIHLEALKWTIDEEKQQWDRLKGSLMFQDLTHEEWMASYIEPLERELQARLNQKQTAE